MQGDTENKRTGGCSSFSVPARSGLAVKLEKMPSFWMPLPNTTRFELAAAAAETFDLVGSGGVLAPLGGVCCDELLSLPAV